MTREAIFRIAPHAAGSPRGDLAAMGGKAFDLARLARLGLPVPPAFVLGTAHCRQWHLERERYQKKLPHLLREQLHWLQTATGRGFGDPRTPLLVSVRSGAPLSMPGMMDTLLNIGLCDATIHGLLRLSGHPRQVWDSYRRLIASFAEIVLGAPTEPFRAALDELMASERVERPGELDYRSLADLAQRYLRMCQELTGSPFPQDPSQQLELAVQAVFASWGATRASSYRRLYGIADDLYTAATVQSMVFGNSGGRSGSGVGFTRDPATGAAGLFFDFLFNSQGEDIVSGRGAGSDAARLFETLPGLRQELSNLCATLEGEFRDAQEFEFTVQDGRLYLLQTRSAKRTPWAALRIAVEQVREGLIERSEALARLAEVDLDGIRRETVESGASPPLCSCEPAGIGVAVGPLAFDAESARRYQEEGQAAVLVREDLSTGDIATIAGCCGVLTVRGNRTSHAAVVARQLGKPCVTGCGQLRLDPWHRTLECGGRVLSSGDTITLDANTGRVYAGALKLQVEYPEPWLSELRR